jgi:hypothetical protein
MPVTIRQDVFSPPIAMTAILPRMIIAAPEPASVFHPAPLLHASPAVAMGTAMMTIHALLAYAKQGNASLTVYFVMIMIRAPRMPVTVRQAAFSLQRIAMMEISLPMIIVAPVLASLFRRGRPLHAIASKIPIAAMVICVRMIAA